MDPGRSSPSQSREWQPLESWRKCSWSNYNGRCVEVSNAHNLSCWLTPSPFMTLAKPLQYFRRIAVYSQTGIDVSGAFDRSI